MQDGAAVEEAKRGLRFAMRAARLAQPAWLAAVRSRRIAARLSRLSAVRRGRLILGYAAVRGEADPGEALRACRRAGAQVALPRVSGPRRLEFHLVTDASTLLPGAFGIPEPAADARTRVDPRDAGLVLVPGTVFSLTGDRIGSGQGFYDALLATLSVPAVGLGYELQVVAAIPAARHDRRLDALVTERRLLLFGGSG